VCFTLIQCTENFKKIQKKSRAAGSQENSHLLYEFRVRLSIVLTSTGPFAMNFDLGRSWNLSVVNSNLVLPSFNTIQGLRNREILEYHESGCLSNANLPKHSVNQWHSMVPGIATGNGIIPGFVMGYDSLLGTTIWLNEYMAVGHMMYDLFLLEALRATKVDRIILQRAPCSTSDLCLGAGTWRSFYQLFYSIAIDAFQPGIPLYFRLHSNQENLRPMYLTLNSSLDSNEYVPRNIDEIVVLKRDMCFEKLVRRKCNLCFYSGVSPEAVLRFKSVAYTAVRNLQLVHTFTEGSSISILLAYRAGLTGRTMGNVPFLIKYLQKGAESPRFTLQTKCTSSEKLGAVEQIQMMAEAQIVISEHGAFQSNMIYMRNSSLFIELRGDYSSGEYQNYEELARLFGVFYAVVVVTDLREHRGSFNISSIESEQIISIIHKYASEAPFKQNTELEGSRSRQLFQTVLT
jgi:hypothetical protein